MVLRSVHIHLWENWGKSGDRLQLPWEHSSSSLTYIHVCHSYFKYFVDIRSILEVVLKLEGQEREVRTKFIVGKCLNH